MLSRKDVAAGACCGAGAALASAVLARLRASSATVGMPVSAWEGSTPKSAGSGVERAHRGKLGSVGTASGDGVAQISEGDRRRARLALAADLSMAVESAGMASSSLAILWSSVVSCGARSDESPARSASASAPSFAFSAATSILQRFQARRVRGLLGGERAVDLALQFLLDVADLGVERCCVGDRAAILCGLGERVQRSFEARHAGGEIGDIGRRLHFALFQCLDPRIQRPESLGVAGRRRRGFELERGGSRAGEVRRLRRALRRSCSRQPPPHDADQAAKQPRGEMGHEALELGRLVLGGGPSGRSASIRRRRAPRPRRRVPALPSRLA